MAWSNSEFKSVHSTIKGIVIHRFAQLQDADKDILISAAETIAWHDQFTDTPEEWYLGQCVSHAAYDLRFSCVESRDAKLKNPKPTIVSLDNLTEVGVTHVASHDDCIEADSTIWEPADQRAASLWNDEYWVLDAFREKGTEMMKFVLERVRIGDTLEEIANAYNVTLQTLKFHLRKEADAIMNGKALKKHKDSIAHTRPDSADNYAFGQMAIGY